MYVQFNKGHISNIRTDSGVVKGGIKGVVVPPWNLRKIKNSFLNIYESSNKSF